jgi:hypothetical protein
VYYVDDGEKKDTMAEELSHTDRQASEYYDDSYNSRCHGLFVDELTTDKIRILLCERRKQSITLFVPSQRLTMD